ncbi:MAG TPA: tetratricopeptide repeat protein, partial [Longimicrobiaceae bacterium]|nr:tetratricopeptide repeat protein [Longimicrobiaceae bacterium]
MRLPHALSLTLVLLAARAGVAQTGGSPPDAQRWVQEAERLQDTDPEAALRLAQRALPRLASPADAPLRMRAHEVRCWSAAAAAPDSVPAFAAAGVDDAARSRQPRALAALRVCRGYGHESVGRTREAMEDYEFGVAEGRRLGARDLLADALVLRGEMRYYLGDFTRALADLDESYRLYTALADEGQQRYALNAIANLYADAHVGQYERALDYYRQVLESHRRAGNEREMATAYFNLGSTLERMGRLEEALAYYRRALAGDRRRGDRDEVAVDQRAVAAVLYKLGRPAASLAVVDSALRRFRAAGDAEMIAQGRLTRGVALRMLGRTDEALAELEAARVHFAATGNQRFLEKVHEERAQAYAAAELWREAFAARGDQLVLQRALGEQAREEQSARLRVQFDAERKEAENRALLRQSASAARIRRLQLA